MDVPICHNLRLFFFLKQSCLLLFKLQVKNKKSFTQITAMPVTQAYSEQLGARCR